MKGLKYIFSFLALFVAFPSTLHASTPIDSTILKSMDSVEISLLTCGPGNEVWSLYGHTAIRYQDLGRDQDVIVNYGMFDLSKKNFVLRFVFGLTDYQMGIQTFQNFMHEYAEEGRWVRQQRLNLTREEKWNMTQAIDMNYRPENRVYRYNYLYDNCTTRARDMIAANLQGTVSYNIDTDAGNSYRKMVRQWTKGHAWAALGNDLLLGVQADRPTKFLQRQFLPDSLRKDFDEAFIIGKDGSRRTLVDSTSFLIPVDIAQPVKDCPVSPALAGFLFLALTVVISFSEWKKGRICWIFDLLVLLVTGLMGIILTAMIFSQHPTVRLNFQILLFNPLAFAFLYPIVRDLRRLKFNKKLTFLTACYASTLILGAFQHYQTAVYTFAITLFLRYVFMRYSLATINGKSNIPAKERT